MSKTTWTYDVDAQALLKRLDELEGKNRKLEERLKNVASTGKKSKTTLTAGFNDIEKSILNAAKSMGVFVASTLSVSKGVGLLKDFDDYLRKIGERNKTTADSMRSFALLQDKGQVASATAKLGKVASQYGIRPEDAAAMAGPIQSMYGGDLDKAMPDIQMAMKLRKMGVASETISEMAVASIPKGLSLGETASKFYNIAKDSPLDPEHIGLVTPAMAAYRDPMTAAAVAAALKQGGLNTGSISDRTKDLGLALQLDSDLRKKAVKAAGGAQRYESLSEIDQIEMMRRQVKDLNRDNKLDMGEVMRAGLLEQQKGQALALVFEQMPALKQFRAAADTAGPDLIGEELGKLEDDPNQRRALAMERQSARAEWLQYFGQSGELAGKATDTSLVAGVENAAAGREFLNDPETGRAGFWSTLWSELTAPSPQRSGPTAGAGFVGTGATQPTGMVEEPTAQKVSRAEESMQKQVDEAAERYAMQQLEVLKEIAANTRPTNTGSVAPAVARNSGVE